MITSENTDENVNADSIIISLNLLSAALEELGMVDLSLSAFRVPGKSMLAMMILSAFVNVSEREREREFVNAFIEECFREDEENEKDGLFGASGGGSQQAWEGKVRQES
jgi:hypothetical protein